MLNYKNKQRLPNHFYMNLVSIQGKYASGYHLTGEKLQIAHQLMKGLSDHNYLIISSKFRSDILYSSLHEKNDTIIKLWCWYMDKDFVNIEYKKFFRAYNDEDCIIHFFNRLVLLKQYTPWFDAYVSTLHSVIETQENDISQILKDCIKTLPISEIEEIRNSNIEVMNQPEAMDLQTIVTRALSKRSLN